MRITESRAIATLGLFANYWHVRLVAGACSRFVASSISSANSHAAILHNPCSRFYCPLQELITASTPPLPLDRYRIESYVAPAGRRGSLPVCGIVRSTDRWRKPCKRQLRPMCACVVRDFAKSVYLTFARDVPLLEGIGSDNHPVGLRARLTRA